MSKNIGTLRWIEKLSSNVFTVILFFVLVSLNAQPPSIEWQKTIGGTDLDKLRAVDATEDGGFILGGFSSSNNSGEKSEDSKGGGADLWVVKLDAAGNILWQKTIGGDGYEELHNISQTTDGGYILGAFSNSGISGDKTEVNMGGWDYWVIKLDANGAILWQNTIGGSGNDLLYYGVQQTRDGGYILGGYSSSDISGDKSLSSFGSEDYWVVKLNPQGAIEWQKTYGGVGSDQLMNLDLSDDNGYILSGYFNSDISGNKTENGRGGWDYWIVKIDSTGIILWQKTLGGDMDEFPFPIQQTYDAGYIVAGHSLSGISGNKTTEDFGEADVWVIKMDKDGEVLWQKNFGGNKRDGIISLKQTTEGGYLLGAYSGSGISGNKTSINYGMDDCWLIKLDSLGNSEWQKSIGGSGSEYILELNLTKEGGIFLGTFSNSDSSGIKSENSRGTWDYWPVKLCGTYNTTLIPIHVCSGDSVMIFGEYHRENGIYHDTLQTVKGCDSIVHVELIVHPDYEIDDGEMEICSGEEAIIYGNPQAKSGIYYDSLVTFYGCDSIHYTQLKVTHLNTKIDWFGDTLKAQISDASYQWLDCGGDTATMIIYATERAFVPEKNGFYSVIISKDGCMDTSKCIEVTTVNTSSSTLFNTVHVYPNPAQEALTIAGEIPFHATFGLFDLTGRKIWSKEITNEVKIRIDVSEYEKGVYLWCFKGKKAILTGKVVLK